MHSVKPCLISNGQVSLSFPYFFANQLLSPAFTKCGDSNTTKWNELQSNGMSLKSAIISGLAFNARPSHNVSLNCRLSMYKTSLWFLSNQNILLPQQASKIGFTFPTSLQLAKQLN